MPCSLIFNDYIQSIASEIYKRKTRGSYAKLTQVELRVVSVVFSKEKQGGEMEWHIIGYFSVLSLRVIILSFHELFHVREKLLFAS